VSANFVDGALVWVDLRVPDVARAAEFYGSVFAWRFESAGRKNALLAFSNTLPRARLRPGGVAECDGSAALLSPLLSA
jgi:predicted enzyme related to lactoylglutathione lyase